jgi:hypothetical protein
MAWESLFIWHIVTDEDGSLKVEHLDEFDDSKVFSEVNKAILEATAMTAAKAK